MTDFRSYDPELATLLRQAKEINPKIRYVLAEITFGDFSTPLTFWAHSDDTAWCGSTTEELLADIAASALEQVA